MLIITCFMSGCVTKNEKASEKKKIKLQKIKWITIKKYIKVYR